MTVDLADLAPGTADGWAAYVAGVVWALREAGHRRRHGPAGRRPACRSGSGLSSSHALECAVAWR